MATTRKRDGIAKDVAKLFKVSPNLVQKVMRGERENEAIRRAYNRIKDSKEIAISMIQNDLKDSSINQ